MPHPLNRRQHRDNLGPQNGILATSLQKLPNLVPRKYSWQNNLKLKLKVDQIAYSDFSWIEKCFNFD